MLVLASIGLQVQGLRIYLYGGIRNVFPGSGIWCNLGGNNGENGRKTQDFPRNVAICPYSPLVATSFYAISPLLPKQDIRGHQAGYFDYDDLDQRLCNLDRFLGENR